MLKLDGLIGNITGYVETRIELLKLELKEDLAKALARAIVFVVLAFVFTLFILLISIAVAYKIGESTGIFGGFAIVAGFYLLLTLVLLFFRDAIGEKLEKQLSEKMKQKNK